MEELQEEYNVIVKSAVNLGLSSCRLESSFR